LEQVTSNKVSSGIPSGHSSLEPSTGLDAADNMTLSKVGADLAGNSKSVHAEWPLEHEEHEGEQEPLLPSLPTLAWLSS
jgi:hypothetical protein